MTSCSGNFPKSLMMQFTLDLGAGVESDQDGQPASFALRDHLWSLREGNIENGIGHAKSRHDLQSILNMCSTFQMFPYLDTLKGSSIAVMFAGPFGSRGTGAPTAGLQQHGFFSGNPKDGPAVCQLNLCHKTFILKLVCFMTNNPQQLEPFQYKETRNSNTQETKQHLLFSCTHVGKAGALGAVELLYMQREVEEMFSSDTDISLSPEGPKLFLMAE
ncbi:hypothetical protein BTVI_20771 [Pitangus sulphuratus]|nr:hypothetical protein BTVI_20771 [Pitangus sulphuratus]